MAKLKLDPKRTALLIQDMQNDVIIEKGAFAESGSPQHAKEQNVVANVKKLATAFRKTGAPVIHVWYIVEKGAPGLKLKAPLFEGVKPEDLDEAALNSFMALSYAPDPDLFIRTGGEKRISNFLIWQLAYTELYFTDRYWPDFGADDVEQAFAWYRGRERRFGRTSEQLASPT